MEDNGPTVPIFFVSARHSKKRGETMYAHHHAKESKGKRSISRAVSQGAGRGTSRPGAVDTPGRAFPMVEQRSALLRLAGAPVQRKLYVKGKGINEENVATVSNEVWKAFVSDNIESESSERRFEELKGESRSEEYHSSYSSWASISNIKYRNNSTGLLAGSPLSFYSQIKENDIERICHAVGALFYVENSKSKAEIVSGSISSTIRNFKSSLEEGERNSEKLGDEERKSAESIITTKRNEISILEEELSKLEREKTGLLEDLEEAISKTATLNKQHLEQLSELHKNVENLVAETIDAKGLLALNVKDAYYQKKREEFKKQVQSANKIDVRDTLVRILEFAWLGGAYSFTNLDSAWGTVAGSVFLVVGNIIEAYDSYADATARLDQLSKKGLLALGLTYIVTIGLEGACIWIPYGGHEPETWYKDSGKTAQTYGEEITRVSWDLVYPDFCRNTTIDQSQLEQIEASLKAQGCRFDFGEHREVGKRNMTSSEVDERMKTGTQNSRTTSPWTFDEVEDDGVKQRYLNQTNAFLESRNQPPYNMTDANSHVFINRTITTEISYTTYNHQLIGESSDFYSNNAVDPEKAVVLTGVLAGLAGLIFIGRKCFICRRRKKNRKHDEKKMK